MDQESHFIFTCFKAIILDCVNVTLFLYNNNILTSICPSINPYIAQFSAAYLGLDYWRNSQIIHLRTSLFPAISLSSSKGDTDTFPGHLRDINSLVSPRCALRPAPTHINIVSPKNMFSKVILIQMENFYLKRYKTTWCSSSESQI